MVSAVTRCKERFADIATVHTGEEEEETVYQTRVKLYAMEGNAWKERGVGALKLNKRRDGGAGARLGEQSIEHILNKRTRH